MSNQISSFISDCDAIRKILYLDRNEILETIALLKIRKFHRLAFFVTSKDYNILLNSKEFKDDFEPYIEPKILQTGLVGKLFGDDVFSTIFMEKPDRLINGSFVAIKYY